MEKIYTYTDVVKWAEGAIEKMGSDYVYEMPDSEGICSYVHTVEGDVLVAGCIVGHMITDNTCVPLAFMDGFKDWGNSSIASIARALPIPFTEKALAFMIELQRAQDQGETWGAALRLAKMSV